MPTAPPENTLKPGLPHLFRAVERYFNRLGSQFAGAITYYSVLAAVPVLLLAFSVAGIVLTVTRPDLLENLVNASADAVGAADPGVRQQVLDRANSALSNWRATGIAALVTGIYSGAGWMGNLKNAVRAQWRPQFDLPNGPGGNVVVTLLRNYVVNLLQLALLLVLMAVTFGLASVSTSLTGTVLNGLGVADESWLRPVLQYLPLVPSIGTGFVLFMFLYTVLPETREPGRFVRRGSLVGAVGLAVLQYLSTYLIGRFSGNPAFAVFGSVIALMLFLNLFAQLILFIAAWIGTAQHPAVPAVEEQVRYPLQPVEPAGTDVVAPAAPQPGARAGYLVGAATGLGAGAALVWLVSRSVRGRR